MKHRTNKQVLKTEIPSEIYINKNDLVFFSDFSIYINISRLEETKDTEEKNIRLLYNYKTKRYDNTNKGIHYLLADMKINDIIVHDYKEKKSFKRYNKLSFVSFSI